MLWLSVVGLGKLQGRELERTEQSAEKEEMRKKGDPLGEGAQINVLAQWKQCGCFIVAQQGHSV